MTNQPKRTESRVSAIIDKLMANAQLINSAKKGEIVINFSDSSISASVKVHLE